MNLLKISVSIFIFFFCIFLTLSAESEVADTNVIAEANAKNAVFQSKSEKMDSVILYVYRFGDESLSLSYKLNLDDSTLCRVKNDWSKKITLYKEGVFILWAQSAEKTELPIHIKKGGVYYIRCSVEPDTWTGYYPYLELMDEHIGKEEYLSIVEGNYESLITLNTGLEIKCHILQKDKKSIKISFLKNEEETISVINRDIIQSIKRVHQNGTLY